MTCLGVFNLKFRGGVLARLKEGTHGGGVILERGTVDFSRPFVVDPVDEGAGLFVFILATGNVGVWLEQAILPDVADVESLNPFRPAKAA